MKFLVDAHLPRHLCVRLRARGHDALHTLDLPLGNRTSDAIINRISLEEERIVITKDADFVDALLVQGQPYKLLLISTGNIRNRELEALLLGCLDSIVSGFDDHVFIELNRTTLQFHF